MVFVFLGGYALGAPSYTTCPDANFALSVRSDSETFGMTESIPAPR